ncbi:thiamine pyrophosphate-dependent enzyme [Bradyrhizobium sp. RDT10]
MHVSLPSDILDEEVEAGAISWPEAHDRSDGPDMAMAIADGVLAAIALAKRPIIFAPPQLSSVGGRALLKELEEATHAPAVILESLRGIADATLGAFADLLREVDLVVLLGKALDFTTRWTAAPDFRSDVRVIAIDPEAALVERAARETGSRLLIGCMADVRNAAKTLIARASSADRRGSEWFKKARAALDHRPREWASVASSTEGRLHPAELFRALRPHVESDEDAVLVCDGGEIGQWAQSMLPVRRRLTNGISGSIGGSISLALAARYAEPSAPVFAVLGDGTIGFHLAEFETAVRCRLPFVAVVGNDGCWNAESQIQLKTYGPNRMHGCELTPARYDLVMRCAWRTRGICGSGGRPSRCDRPRPCKREAGLHKRHDRKRRGSDDAPGTSCTVANSVRSASILSDAFGLAALYCADHLTGGVGYQECFGGVSDEPKQSFVR